MEFPATRINQLSFILLCGVPIFCVLAYGAVHQPIIAIFYLFVGLIAVLWAVDSFAKGSVQFSTSYLQIPLLFLGIYGFIQTIPFGVSRDITNGLEIGRTISLEPYATQLTSIHIIFLCIFFAASLTYIDRQSRIRKLIAGITAFGLIYSFYAIIQSILSPNKIYGIYEPGSATPFGSFVNRHNFAAIIEMAIAIPLAMLFTGAVEKHKRMLYWVAISLMATALLLSGSRGGLVALVAGLIFLTVLTIKRNGLSNLKLTAALAGAILVVAMVGAVFVGGDTSLTRFSDAAATSNVSSSRTQIWSGTLDVIFANLPFGAGLGAFPQAYAKFDPESGAQRVEQAHNDYLQVISDAGVAGLILGVLFLYQFFSLGVQSTRILDPTLRAVALGAFTGCFIILVHSLFDFVLHITAVSLMFLLLLSLLVATRRDEVGLHDTSDERRDKGVLASITTIRR